MNIVGWMMNAVGWPVSNLDWMVSTLDSLMSTENSLECAMGSKESMSSARHSKRGFLASTVVTHTDLGSSMIWVTQVSTAAQGSLVSKYQLAAETHCSALVWGCRRGLKT